VNGLRAHIERRPEREAVDLFILRDYGAGLQELIVGPDGERQWIDVRPGVHARPLVQMAYDEFDALADAIQGVTRASSQTIDALADTREVRDRLLTMIEQSQVASIEMVSRRS
jgi:hypothetical protein